MDRRMFLLKSISFLFGSLCGLKSFSKALAYEESKNKAFVQPRIALIIDDIGPSFYRARQFLKLCVPITFAILPKFRKSHPLAMEINSQGHEIMLHQPMEPYQSDINPGPGALYVGDGAARIFRIMEENVSDVPFVAGVNNHMGSKFTTREKEMGEVLTFVKERSLFFVDSVTTGRSMGYETAKRLHMDAAFRNIFLDNRLEESAILSQLRKLKRHALKYGRAIGIGHPFPETAKAIDRFLRDHKHSGLSFVHISHVLRTQNFLTASRD
jgi:polysaccharide deacetylase 2 family uncharacterized protein YibQ